MTDLPLDQAEVDGSNVLQLPEPYIDLNPTCYCTDAKKDVVKPALAETWASIDPKVVLGHQAFYSDVVRHAPALELTVRYPTLLLGQKGHLCKESNIWSVWGAVRAGSEEPLTV